MYTIGQVSEMFDLPISTLKALAMIRKVCFRISSAFQEYASLMKKK